MSIDNIDFRSSPESFREYTLGLSENGLIKVLEKLGRLKNGNLQEPLLELVNHKNSKIRKAAVKNLAKLGQIELAEIFFDSATTDSSTEVRREAVSAIGRMRNPVNLERLTFLLEADDPKVVLQAIRGLNAIKKEIDISAALKKCSNHPNEQVQELLLSLDKPSTKSRKSVKNKLTTEKIGDQKGFDLNNLVIHGDTKLIMDLIPDESIHLTFTSPPYYNARDYSIYKSYREYLEFLEEVFRRVHRITKEGRFLIVNSSPIIVPRISRAHSSKRFPIPFDLHAILVANGWEFIDDIVWLKPEASAKNRNAGFLQHRKPLAYKPNAITEMLMVYRKKTDKLIDWNINQYEDFQVEASKVEDGYETSNVWKVDPSFDKTHSAVFPKALCERIIKYYSMIGDLVFDPFAGSGTLGKVAIDLQRNFLLTEMDDEYFLRIQENLIDSSLFSQAQTRYISYERLQEDVKFAN